MNVLGSRRWWALGALALALLVVGLDGTVLSIALPTLSTRLHASTGQLQWFVDAYLLVLAAVLLPAGLLGDRFGRKKLLLGALVVFGLASLACAYASTAGMLIAARSVLGLSAAFLMPLSMAVLPVLFTPEERPRALGIWVTASAASFPIGPIVGGWLLDNFWWGSVFLINVPVIALGLIAVSLLVPESRDPHPARLDIVGALTSSLGLAGITYGFIEAGEKGWGSSTSLGAIAAGVVALGAFVLWQRWITRRPAGQPLVDLGLFRSASFTWGTILATVMNFALFGLLFAIPQYFQAVKGADALGTGLRLLPLIGGLVVGARVGGRLVPRAGAKVVVALGFALLVFGLLSGATTGDDSDPGGSPGRRRHRRGGARHRAELVVPGPARRDRAAGAGRRRGARERLRRGRRGAYARLHTTARPGQVGVHPWDGHDAVGLRRAGRRRDPADPGVPAIPVGADCGCR